ncbi:hypothetical protein G5S34_23275 [Herbaspirillum frisingense]|uniref:hypothetical protein n=1 Tax=Herbaspirillum frisingense TaxID=92645 RepID=UPI00160315FB|nr:hypothetical protein [Herbaspirillum frisingense]QNB09396.1 hypothetical protein G5S34_23275 [Herbaspirillum frisingense]
MAAILFFARSGFSPADCLFRFAQAALKLLARMHKRPKMAPVLRTALNLIKNVAQGQKNIPQIQ